MTITYHAGRRIQGLSNDIVETPTLDDNFTTNTGWVMNDATAVTISGGKLNASFSGDGTNDSVAYNLGFVAGSKWILDYEFNITSFVRGNNVGSYYIVALSNLNQTANYNATLQNAMWAIHGCHPYAPYADDIWLGKSVNQSLDITQDGEIGAGITATGGAFPPWLTGTPYYARFIRLSDTSYSFGLYTNPERTTLVEDTSVFTGTLVADSLTNLQYIVIRNYNGDVAGSIDITFDNFKFYNGVSSLTSKPTNVQAGSRFEETDTRKIYFYKDPLTINEDFDTPTYTWNTIGSLITVDSTTDNRLEGSVNRSTTLHGTGIDIGYALSNTAWVMRFKLDLTFVQSSANGAYTFFCLSNLPYSSGTRTTQDSVGFSFLDASVSKAMSLIAGNDSYLESAVYSTGVDSSTFVRYVQVVRNGDIFTLNIYANNDYTSSQGTATATVANITDLRYFKVQNWDIAVGTWNGSSTYNIDDLKIYNGVTTISNYWSEEA